ncbi:hypothetical protein BJ138DRAFT_1164389 [Hygrophoropsis aurantiaca]|uniref:Uncharacterized protein n=1 Tax=Hygrophoropsis aurantiaca TaxID=72124 RepID=A0ACB7ZX51_9AGAM|nr:hypothetical protein BJ138DRAFT_1164389 [Hygrophoropsis aurantiaca]
MLLTPLLAFLFTAGLVSANCKKAKQEDMPYYSWHATIASGANCTGYSRPFGGTYLESGKDKDCSPCQWLSGMPIDRHVGSFEFTAFDNVPTTYIQFHADKTCTHPIKDAFYPHSQLVQHAPKAAHGARSFEACNKKI